VAVAAMAAIDMPWEIEAAACRPPSAAYVIYTVQVLVTSLPWCQHLRGVPVTKSLSRSSRMAGKPPDAATTPASASPLVQRTPLQRFTARVHWTSSPWQPSVGSNLGSAPAGAAHRQRLYEVTANSPIFVPTIQNITCTVCNKSIGFDVQDHANGKKHQKALQRMVCGSTTPCTVAGALDLASASAAADAMKNCKQQREKRGRSRSPERGRSRSPH
jgi:hypothetical protein